MKRVFLGALLVALAAAGWAQGTFTIRRPVDGATVREVVRLRIPKNSVPEGGYVGVYVNGRFVEAAQLTPDGQDLVYGLDTQARGIPDGPTKIELVLFVDNGTRSQIVNRSSIDVKVDNQTSIAVPASGVALRYRFVPGSERTYQLTIKSEQALVSQAQARLGSRAANFAEQSQTVRVLYAVDNVFRTASGIEGLLRIQGLPDRGKDYTRFTFPGDAEPTVIRGDQFVSTYMRVTDVGREVNSTAPVYWGIDGVNGRSADTSFWAILPWPVLPTKKVKPGDVWQGAYSFSDVDIPAGEIFEKDKFTRTFPARGTFEGVQWYKGIPCARIKMTVALGEQDLRGATNIRMLEGQAVKIELTETTLIALDRGIIVRQELQLNQEALVDAPGGGGGLGGDGGAMGAGGGPPSGGSRRGSRAGAGGGGPAGAPGDDKQFGPVVPGLSDSSLQNRGSRGGGAMGVGQADDDEQDQRGGGRFGQGGGSGGTGRQKMILRLRISQITELER